MWNLVYFLNENNFTKDINSYYLCPQWKNYQQKKNLMIG